MNDPNAKRDEEPDENNPGLVEYGLILAGVSIAALIALLALGPRITQLMQAVSATPTPIVP